MNKVCIDAGHGMSNSKFGLYDPGAVAAKNGIKYEEADIALRYALALRSLLNTAGIPVFMTRDDAQDHSPVGQRAANAKAAGCNLFISIHLNASDQSSANGVETLYNDEADKNFAQEIQNSLVKSLGLKDRKVKPRPDLAVLKFKGTAVLIELGFISNDKDREKIINPLTRSTVCEGIVEVVQKFFKGNVKEARPASDKLHLHG